MTVFKSLAQSITKLQQKLCQTGKLLGNAFSPGLEIDLCWQLKED